MSDVIDLNRRRDAIFLKEGAAPLRLAGLYLDEKHRHNGTCLVARWQGDYYRYSAGCYRILRTETIHTELYRLLERVDVVRTVAGKAQRAPLNPNIKILNETRAAMLGHVHHVDGDQPRWINGVTGPSAVLPCPNGLLDMRTLELRDATPHYFTTNVAGASWNPYAEEPRAWLSFLGTLWPNDPVSVRALQQLFGYLLSTDTDQQKLFLLVGPPRSGKGTIARIIRALVGAEAVANPLLGTLAESFGLQPLIGKKVAIIGDARLGGKTDHIALVERLLSLSGEDAITINRKHQDAVTMRLGTRVVIVTNELPQFRDAATAIASRFVIIPTTKSFLGQEDLELESRLMLELPGILKWGVEGYRMLREAGHFSHGEGGRAMVEDLIRMSSPVSGFLDEVCVRDSELTTKASDLYYRWESWCQETGHTPGNTQKFGRDLKAAVPGLVTTRKGKGGAGGLFYKGLGFSNGN